jgi:hypothetical protein
MVDEPYYKLRELDNENHIGGYAEEVNVDVYETFQRFPISFSETGTNNRTP